MRSSNPRFSEPAKGLFRSFFLGAFALAALPLQAGDNPGDRPDTIHFANTELSGLTQLQRKYGPFRDALESALGMEVEFTPVPSRTAAATALQSDEVDVVFTGPAEYVAIRSQTEVRPIIGLTRPGYRSVIAVRSDSGIDSMQDLEGHTIVMEEIGSTSAHLGPTVLLNQAGLEPGKDVEVRMLGDNFIHAFANDRGDALGAGAHDFKYLSDEYGEDRYRVLKEGRDLPNDLFLARADMSDELVARIREAFVEHEQKLLDAILSVESNRKYSESGFTSVQNSDYDPIREAYRAAGISDFSDAP